MSDIDGQAPVLFITRKWAPAIGGMENYSVQLVQAMAKLAPVETIALPGRADGRPPSAVSLLGFPLRVARRLWRMKRRPAVVHLGDMAIWPLALLARLRFVGVPLAISAHGTDVAYPRRGGAKGRLYGAYLRLGARLLRDVRMIANSDATVRVAAETGWQSFATVPLATDIAAPPPDGAHDGTLLFVGRLVERKGCGWFIREVLPHLPATLRLRVAGTGWDDSEKAALDHPRVEFLGSLAGEALIAAYRRALCVVVPNIKPASGEYEGFGLVAPEAAAAGGLVLAARCGGLTDAVREGETGLMAAPGDAKEWARKIDAIAHWSPAERLAFVTQAQKQAQRYYNWNRVARQTLAAYGS